MLEITEVPPIAVEIAQGICIDIPAVTYAGFDNGEFVGSGGLAWCDGRCWIFFSVQRPIGRAGALRVIRFAKRLERKAAQLGASTVFTPRDAQHETSTKLLKTLGYELHSIENNIELWARNVRD